MTPTEFVAGLSDVMGVGRTEIATVDRALAKAGMRQIARGRSRPDITLREGIQILCAWLGAQNLTESAAELHRLGQYYTREIPSGEYDNLTRGRTTFANVLGEEERAIYGMNFLDFACWVAQQLGADKGNADKIWVSVTKGGAPHAVTEWQFRDVRQHFDDRPANFVIGEMKKVPDVNVHTTSSVRGRVLRWIFDATEGV